MMGVGSPTKLNIDGSGFVSEPARHVDLVRFLRSYCGVADNGCGRRGVDLEKPPLGDFRDSLMEVASLV
jgi:hypothetical protein